MSNNVRVAQQGQRQCHACEANDPIKLGEALWPHTWSCPACGRKPQVKGAFLQLAPELDDGDAGYDIASFDFLAGHENQHFWFIARNELIEWLVRKFAAGAKTGLEIGCGTGFVLNAFKSALPHARICGSELHTSGLVHASKRHSNTVELFQMDARKPGLSDALDLVGAFDVLEHIEEDQTVLGECARMLRPGGVLIATVPQHPWLWSSQDDIAHHVRRYKRGQLAERARHSGLVPVYQSSFVTLTFPLMVASRLVKGRGAAASRQREQVEAEFKIPKILNQLMLALQRIEHAGRRLGVPLPFGGSQVLVAMKPDG
jgi:SAM-dependent methyltransferase